MYYRRSTCNTVLILTFIFTSLFTATIKLAYGYNSKKVVLKLTYFSPGNSSIEKGVNNFLTCVKEKTQGDVVIESYPRDKFSNLEEIFNLLKGETIDFAVIPTGLLFHLNNSVKILELPFLFSNYVEVDSFLDNKAGESILNKFSDKGYEGLTYYEEGFIGIASRKPIMTVADYKGLRIRIPETTPYASHSITLLGASSVPIPYSQVYEALKQGAVDANLTTFHYYKEQRYYELLKYFSETRQFYLSQILLMNKTKYQHLSEGTRNIVKKCALESSKYQRGISRGLEQEGEKSLVQREAKIIKIPDRVGMRRAEFTIYQDNAKLWEMIDCGTCPLPPWCCSKKRSNR
jgi:tripartite ATP-independent transporter DctP family solute receptor